MNTLDMVTILFLLLAVFMFAFLIIKMIKYTQMLVDDMGNMYDGIREIEKNLNKLIEPIKKVEKNLDISIKKMDRLTDQHRDIAKALKNIYAEVKFIDDRTGNISFEIARHFRNIEVKEEKIEVQNE